MVSSAPSWSSDAIQVDGLEEGDADVAQPLHRGTVLLWHSNTELVLKLICELTALSHSCLVIRTKEEFEFVLITEPLCAVVMDEKQKLDPSLQKNLSERIPMLLLGGDGAVTIPFLADWLSNSSQQPELIERLFQTIHSFLNPVDSPELQVA